MSIDTKRLAKDRAYWDEVAPEGATHYDPEDIGAPWMMETVPNEDLRGQQGGVTSQYLDEYGKGEWTAKSMADALQMAIDFANGVS